MKLYINRLSPNVFRVRLTAAVLDLALEEVPLDFAKGAHKAPEYLALNPNGAVPALVDGDFVLTESRAIMQYLADQRPESGLMPADARGRAEVARWQFWDSAHFAPQVSALAFQRVLKKLFKMGEPDAAKVDEALGNLRRFGAVLDQQLKDRLFVIGDALTLADLTLAGSLMYAQRADVPLQEHPNLLAWFNRMNEMDAWKRASA